MLHNLILFFTMSILSTVQVLYHLIGVKIIFGLVFVSAESVLASDVASVVSSHPQ